MYLDLTVEYGVLVILDPDIGSVRGPPMVPLVILPIVSLVSNGTIGLPMVPTVPLGEQLVPLV